MLRHKLDHVAAKIFSFLLKNILIKSMIFIKLRYISPIVKKYYGLYSSSIVKNKGVDFRIHGPCQIIGASKMKVGDYVRIGEGAFLNCLGGLEIGTNVQISCNLIVYTMNHDINSTAIPYDLSSVQKPVIIGDSVWIGMNVIITPGVKIGEGAVIGMGAVISKDVPAGAVVVGGAQRTIKERDMVSYRQLVKDGAFFGKIYPNN